MTGFSMVALSALLCRDYHWSKSVNGERVSRSLEKMSEMRPGALRVLITGKEYRFREEKGCLVRRSAL